MGNIFDSLSGMFSLNRLLECPRYTQAKGMELLATFAALAICGLVLRRAIKREDAANSL